MAQEQHMHEIRVVNFSFRGKGLTKVIYKGREACVAQELGQLLEYTKDGQTLTTMIGGRWKSKFVKGKDYEVLQGQDLQDFRELTLSERVSPHLMILYSSGVDLVLLNSKKPITNELHRWLVDEVFPSLRKTGMYTLDGFEQKALPVPALFHREIITALSKIRGAQIAHQKEHATPRDYALDWNETHKAHTAPMFDGVGKTAQEIKAIARQRGLTTLSMKSARQLMYEMVDFRHTNVSESAEIDLERIGVPRDRARRIAIDKGQPYFKALVAEGVDQASLEGQLELPQ
jgi:prophage antirepressor-like protein